MVKPLRVVAEEILSDIPPINIAEVWKISLDDWFHMCDDRCVVCRSTPCEYLE